MFLLRRIKEYCYSLTKHSTLCHPELVSGSHEQEILSHGGQAHKAYTSLVRFVKRVQGDNVFNIPSYRTNEVRCGIFKNILKKIPQCVSLMRDDIKIGHTFKKAFAFTLAETLIVMGIIGVVAALTIPNLNSSTGEKEKIAKVKKIYQNLEDALGRAQAVYGPLDEWKQLDSNVTAQTTRFAQRVTEFMKISKDCGMDTTGKCFVTKDREINGTYSNESQWEYNTNTYKVITADGTSLSFSSLYMRIFADIDGVTKGSSLWGSDLFLFHICDNRVDPFCGGFANNDQPCRDDNDDCVAWVVSYDNMDYLKTKDGTTCSSNTSKKLTWGGNHSCK